jgi:hypothetical protein
MKKLTQSFLISVAILSISCIGAMDEPYRDKGGSAASKIYPYGGQGSRSPYSSPTIMAQLEEGEKAWTSKPPASQPARSQSAEPLHIPSASSAPKLPAEVTTLQPVGGAAPTVAQKFVEPPLVRVASEGIDLSRSWSGSNLSGSVSSSPMVFEHVSVPQSVEVLYNNRIAKQPDQSRLLNRIHPEFEKWCADRIAFWQVYKATQQRLKLKELLLEKKKAAAAQALQAAGQSESSENQSYSAYLSNILVTTPAQHADSIRRTEEKIRRAKDDFERLQNQAKAMHPQCSQEQLDRFAFTPLNPRQPYFSRPTEIVKVFTHSPLDQIIAISMLEGFSDILPPVYRVKLPFPNRNKRLEEVNEALNVLWTI